MFNILVTGAKGQLGSEIQDLSCRYPNNYFFTDREELDITNEQAIKNYIEKNDINVIINCAAYTAVDKAESEEAFVDKINHQAVKYLAQTAKAKHIKLIHISTDYVFDGTNHKLYIETDITNPQSVYGKTKFLGEEALLQVKVPNSIIIRTSWVYSSYGSNFVKTMLRLGKAKESLGIIDDQVGTSTYARDLAITILEILPKISNQRVEIYNYSNEGVLSWYDFAKEIMKIAKLSCKIEPIDTKEYPSPAKRPHYSLLSKLKIKKEFSIEIPYWKDSLEACLSKMNKGKV